MNEKALKMLAEALAKQEKENAAVDKVVEGMTVDVPECMIDSRIDSTIRENEARMAQQGLTFEQYLGFMGTTMEQFKEQMKPSAEMQVKGTLALEAIAKAENIEVTDAEVEEQLQKMADAYKMELEKVKGFMRDEDIEAMKADLKITKALDLIVESAKWGKPAAKKTTTKKTTTKKAAEPAAEGEEKPKKTTTRKKTTTAKKEEAKDGE